MANNTPIEEDDDDGDDAPEESAGASGSQTAYQPPAYGVEESAAYQPPQQSAPDAPEQTKPAQDSAKLDETALTNVPLTPQGNPLQEDTKSNEIVLMNAPLTPHGRNYLGLSSRDFAYNDKPAAAPKVASGPNWADLKRAGLAPPEKGGPENWREILYAHAKLNAAGNPVDETGIKEINLKDMNPEFGKGLARTCLAMDAEGHRFRFISGCRTEEEEDVIRAHYEKIGSAHPVGKRGNSPHVYGVATDIMATGGNEQAVYEAFHRLGKKNGLEFVSNDPNHCQIAKAHEVIAQLRIEGKGPATQLAANHSPPRHGAQPIST